MVIVECILLSEYKKGNICFLNSMSDLTTAIASLSKEDREDECIKHSLQVRSAWALNNYHKFFKLYLDAPKMAGYLMDKFVARVRKNYLIAIIKAYVSLHFCFLFTNIVLSILNFSLTVFWMEVYQSDFYHHLKGS